MPPERGVRHVDLVIARPLAQRLASTCAQYLQLPRGGRAAQRASSSVRAASRSTSTRMAIGSSSASAIRRASWLLSCRLSIWPSVLSALNSSSMTQRTVGVDDRSDLPGSSIGSLVTRSFAGSRVRGRASRRRTRRLADSTPAGARRAVGGRSRTPARRETSSRSQPPLRPDRIRRAPIISRRNVKPISNLGSDLQGAKVASRRGHFPAALGSQHLRELVHVELGLGSPFVRGAPIAVIFVS